VGRSAHAGSALFDPLPDAGDLFGRERDVRVPQEAVRAALSIQVPMAAHVGNWSGAHVVEIDLPVVGRVLREKVLLRVDDFVRRGSASVCP
jgi:hypothetical protein